MRRTTVAWLVVPIAAGIAHAQDDQSGVFALSLEDLASAKVSIASIGSRPPREQPAVVTVITAEQIARMGARDLVDILKTVPGFWIQADIVGGVLTPTFRGFPTGEGKILLLIDGVEQNDDLYGAAVIGQRYSAANIRRIEILRGPGSARYGGTAQLAVISVFTKGAEQNGVEATLQTSASERTVTNEMLSFNGGTARDDWSVSFSGHLNRGVKATQTFTSRTGTEIAMDDNSDLRASSLNLAATSAALGWRMQYDDYHFDDRLVGGAGDTQTDRRDFDHFETEVWYDAKVSDFLTITPRFSYTCSHPWGYQWHGELQRYAVRRYEAEIEAKLHDQELGDLLLGVNFYRVQAELMSGIIGFGFDPATHFGDDQVHHNDFATYGQYDFDTSLATFSLGVRYEDLSSVGDEIVPRFAVTRAWDEFHGKLMVSRAFRVPQIETINSAVASGGSIVPERLNAIEAEVGYTSDRTVATANLFWFENERSIYFDAGASGNRNGGRVENWGGELEVHHTIGRVTGRASYSYYQSIENQVPLTVPTGHDRANLGVPQHKVVLDLSWLPTDATSVNVTSTVVGRRWAQEFDGAGLSLQTLNPEMDLSVHLRHQAGNLTWAMGVTNLLDTDVFYAQPYDGGLTPVPGQGRGLDLSMTARF